jgi:hypothetical protein
MSAIRPAARLLFAGIETWSLSWTPEDAPYRCSAGGVQTVSERSLARDDEWHQRQAELDAQAIMQGMAQARQRAEQLARTGHRLSDGAHYQQGIVRHGGWQPPTRPEVGVSTQISPLCQRLITNIRHLTPPRRAAARVVFRPTQVITPPH